VRAQRRFDEIQAALAEAELALARIEGDAAALAATEGAQPGDIHVDAIDALAIAERAILNGHLPLTGRYELCVPPVMMRVFQGILGKVGGAKAGMHRALCALILRGAVAKYGLEVPDDFAAAVAQRVAVEARERREKQGWYSMQIAEHRRRVAELREKRDALRAEIQRRQAAMTKQAGAERDRRALAELERAERDKQNIRIAAAVVGMTDKATGKSTSKKGAAK
jgi:hypothetical protein